MSVAHRVKCVQPFFDRIVSGEKNFEIRKNDRAYQAGDFVTLQEWSDTFFYSSGREISFRIGFVTDFQQADGFVVFSLLPL